MEKKWKILIVAMIILGVWIRLSPAIPWTIEAQDWGNHWCKSQGYYLNYDWSWWSLRFTSIYPNCVGE